MLLPLQSSPVVVTAPLPPPPMPPEPSTRPPQPLTTQAYTWDGHERPLSYIIAPGTYVNDVSQAIPASDRFSRWRDASEVRQ